MIFTGFVFLFLHGDGASSASTSHTLGSQVDSTAMSNDTNSILHEAERARWQAEETVQYILLGCNVHMGIYKYMDKGIV